jgi:hypothetical protein
MDATVSGLISRDKRMLRSRQPGIQEDFVMRLIRPHPEYPAASSEKITAEGTKAPSDTTDALAKHLDYHLQPFGVDALSHYIEAVTDDDRFRVH